MESCCHPTSPFLPELGPKGPVASVRFITGQTASDLPMDGELAFAIVLAAYGNAHIASVQESTPPELLGTNSTLRHVSSVAFLASDAALESAADAIRRTEQGRFEDLHSPRGTSAWFRGLRRAGASRIHVGRLPTQLDLPEVDAVSSSGGISWTIRIEYPSSFRLWVPRWKHEGGEKPWKVSITGSTIPYVHPQTKVGLIETAESLYAALERALDFSTRARLDWFPDDFSEALALLRSQTPEIPYHPDLFPSGGYSLLARQVAASATKAYVFGGMGSFNDLGFESLGLNTEYKLLLPTLYTAVTDALLGAANSFGSE